MRLFIAEKPSVARAIAQGLGTPQKMDGFLKVGDDNITWCYGHLLTLWTPEEVMSGKLGEKQSIPASALPVMPSPFRLRPRDADAAKQVRVIGNLLKQARKVVHAGDPDREGQLLVDEVLQYLGWKGLTRRIWLSAVDPESVKKALVSMKDNKAMQALSCSAEARSQADWLVGMNASIALSRNIQAKGGSGIWSIGRVQTPTLALIVRRDEELRNFRSREFFLVVAHLSNGVRARWQMPEDQVDLDEEGRLTDRLPAEAIARKVSGQQATVTAFTRKEGKREAPLPFALSDLQKAASARYGLSAAQVLEAAQKLYEAGVTTYPRTDCGYLPEEQHADASRILQSLGISGADPQRRHPAWNTTKVEAHHGIIPTGQPLPATASQAMVNVYALIRISYGQLFFPPETFEQREASFEIAGETFIARSKVITDPGWTSLGKASKEEDWEEKTADDEESGNIPVYQKNEKTQCEQAEVVSRTTKPPKPYTDGTLIAAMTRVHAFVDDPKLKARLRETSGIGTEATRAGIIETLLKREYIERRKKELRATEQGVQLVQMLRTVAPTVVDPGTTAIWEDGLASIAVGRLDAQIFMQKQIEAVRSITRRILDADLPGMVPKASGFTCPLCQSALVQRTSRRGTPFFSCLGTDCHAAFFQEKDGTPGARMGDPETKAPEAEGPACLVCNTLTGRFSTAKGHGYYRCPQGHGSWWDDNGKLGKKWEDKPRSSGKSGRK